MFNIAILKVVDRFTFLAKQRAVVLANSLLDQEGKLKDLERIELEYPILPNGYNDGDMILHFQRAIDHLKKSLDIRNLLMSFSLPICDQKHHDMIAITLGLDELKTDRDVIWGVLSALFCPLRQQVGSCFATAPAILIHEE